MDLGRLERRLASRTPQLMDCDRYYAVLVPLAHLLDHPPLEYEYRLVPETRGFPNELVGIPEDYRWQPGKENVPVYPWGKHAIWGLTGRITRNLVKLLSE